MLHGQMVNDLGGSRKRSASCTWRRARKFIQRSLILAPQHRRDSPTLLMAKAFPKSEFHGFDLHPASIEAVNRHAEEQRLTNVHFSIAAAKDFTGCDYGFVTIFDALPDMGDPVGATSHVRKTIQSDGTCMILEPIAGDSLAENMNPVGRVYYGFSTMICTPASFSREVGLALGAQAGERRMMPLAFFGHVSIPMHCKTVRQLLSV
jgi:hypothetical protein